MPLPTSPAARGFSFGLLVALPIAVYFHVGLLQDRRELRSELAEKESILATTSETNVEIQRYLDRKEELERLVGIINTLNRGELPLTTVMTEIRHAVTEETTLHSVRFVGQRVALTATLPTASEAASLAERLQALPHLEKVSAQRSTQVKTPDRYFLRARWLDAR